MGSRSERWWQSKKFAAFCIFESTTTLVMLLCLLILKDQIRDAPSMLWWLMITLTIVKGFVAAGTILGIASLDRYVRVAQITANAAAGAVETVVEAVEEKLG